MGQERETNTFTVGSWVEFIKPRGSFHHNMGVIQKILPSGSLEILLFSGEKASGMLQEFRKLSESEERDIKEKMRNEDILHVKDIKVGDWVQEKHYPSWHGKIVRIEEDSIAIKLYNGIYLRQKISPWERIHGISKKTDVEGIKEPADADFSIDSLYPEAKMPIEPVIFESLAQVDIAKMLLPVLKDIKGFYHETVTADSPWTGGHLVVQLNAGSIKGDRLRWEEVLRKINKNNHFTFMTFFVEKFERIYEEWFYVEVHLKKEFRDPRFQ